MVKLWEARSDYDRALAAQDVLKKSKLVQCQQEELKVVDMTARQYRWTSMKERGEDGISTFGNLAHFVLSSYDRAIMKYWHQTPIHCCCAEDVRMLQLKFPGC